MKFLHTSDLHLGRPFLGLSPERARERREDLKQVLRNVVVQANDHAVDLVIIAGDLFDSPEPPAALVEFVAYTLRPDAFHRKTNVLLVAGDQDSLRSDSPYLTFEFPKNFVVARSPEWTEFRAAAEGVRVLAASADVDGRDRNIVRELSSRVPEDDVPTLAVVHATWDTPGFHSTRCHPFGDEDMRKLPGVDYVALGQSSIARQVADRPLAWYSGAPEPIFPEMAGVQTGILLGDLRGRGAVDVQSLAVNVRTLREVELDVTSFRHDVEVVDALRKDGDRRACLFLTLTGEPTAEYCPDVDHLEEELARYYFTAQVAWGIELAEPLPGTPGTILGEFTGHLRREVALRARDGSGEAEILQRALRYGVAALAGREL
ncbi:MAG: DNA repair exonuclease [Planctomycetes bacterium]|nr:DNA repair exonuclease [Planctomycetota bacterium]